MATTTALRIGPADHGRTISLEEFQQADTIEGYRYELARGVVEVTEVPSDSHGVVVSNLYLLVSRYVLARPGQVHRFGGGSEFRLWLPGLRSGRNPDLGIVRMDAPRDPRGRRIPALVGEVVSRSSRDRDYVTKREEYLAFGILEYWIVDPIQQSFTFLKRNGDIWVEQVLRDDQQVECLAFPGLVFRVSELWPETAPDGDEDDINPA